MITICLWQRFLIAEQRNYFFQLLWVAASLDCKRVISFELPRKFWLNGLPVHL